MKRAVKLVINDGSDNYLLLTRSNHPKYPNDPDLPGGTIEKGEATLHALVREVEEEISFKIDPNVVKKLIETSTYTTGFTFYLYSITLKNRPDVALSWEHINYQWLNYNDFLSQISKAADSYMHMVYDTLKEI